MVEPYQWLLAHAQEYGYRPEYVGPASVDLCLDGRTREVWTMTQNEADVVHFLPQHFYLASTQECITVPPTHCAFVQMRSSLARRGLGHKMAGFIDPGFTGQVTLELETLLPVEVAVGERIVQLIYMRLTEATKRPYSGRYLHQRGPTPAY